MGVVDKSTNGLLAAHWSRWLVVSLLAIPFGIWQLSVNWGYWQHADLFAGVDYRILIDATHRWLDGQGFYYAYQLAGPYDIHTMDDAWMAPIMYPPTMLLLFVPFSFLPAILWWIVPLGITSWVVYSYRPAPYTWPVLAFLAVFPTTLNMVLTGNPAMWLVAAVTLGTRWGWPSVLVLLKPTMAPFALVGIWRREWWLGLLALILVSLPFLPMWLDYLAVLRNTQTSLGPLYSVPYWPALFIPVVAWLGGR